MGPKTPVHRTMIRKLDSYAPETWAAVLAFAQDYRDRNPGVRFEMTDAVRYLVHKGLEAVGRPTEGQRP